MEPASGKRGGVHRQLTINIRHARKGRDYRDSFLAAMTALPRRGRGARTFGAPAADRNASDLATVWEAAVAVARVLGLSVSVTAEAVEDYVALMEIVVVAVSPEAARIALDAFDRFGKGRHPASLNFGDCFAYACARHLGQPLMFKGGDFPQTDIEAA